MAKSDLEDWLETRLIQSGLTGYVREFQAINGRKWRWDFAYVDARLLIEVHGGTWGKGGHSSGVGIRRDCEKLNAATVNGWRVLAFTGDMVKDDTAPAVIADAILKQ